MHETDLIRTVPALVEAFRCRLDAGRISPINSALDDGNFRHAGRLLCGTIRDQKIRHTDDEHDDLRRIETYLYDTQGPRD